MIKKRVAIVTGANKGIGFEIVRGLCKHFDGHVYLTARNEDLGKKAVELLKEEGHSPQFHQLDITDKESIDHMRNFIQNTYKGLDVLVNNAGATLKGNVSFAEKAEFTMKTNYFGTLDILDALFPLLRPHARVVNISSMASCCAIRKCSPEIVKKFTNLNLTKLELSKLLQDFVELSKTGAHKDQGFCDSAYGMSKVGVTVLSQIQHRQMVTDSREDIIINSCCPGYVSTDMTSHQGHSTPEEGADTPIFLALLPPGTSSPAGEFVADRQIRNWLEYDNRF